LEGCEVAGKKSIDWIFAGVKRRSSSGRPGGPPREIVDGKAAISEII